MLILLHTLPPRGEGIVIKPQTSIYNNPLYRQYTKPFWDFLKKVLNVFLGNKV